jgi:hypothetical protein
MPRTRRYWSDAEIEILRSVAGKLSLDQIAKQLKRPVGSIATKAHELRLSLSYRRQQASLGLNSKPKE